MTQIINKISKVQIIIIIIIYDKMIKVLGYYFKILKIAKLKNSLSSFQVDGNACPLQFPHQPCG